ncbi:MAG: GGDEF domain-containing protein [Actinomycetota bacterium]|nr:GGDEF domain-containing protein [Actinomycetota bacterium]
MQSLKWNADQLMPLKEVAAQFRDHIWVIVESWMGRMESPDEKNLKARIPETLLVDNIPSLLRGISKVIESPERIEDFEPDGVIFESAAELGANRQQQDYKPGELLRELELLREIMWQFCDENFAIIEFYELERRINRPFDKLVSTITEHYINSFESELKRLARRDRLTGFFNYESFKEILHEELKRSKRYRRSFSILLVDIDGFNDYNNTFGRGAGDALLSEVSLVMAQTIRDVDQPVRYGGDEFAIIMPESNKRQAQKAAERLRKAVKLEAKHQVKKGTQSQSPVTISIGLASYPRDAETAHELVSLADEALYEAKQGGRDMVVAVDVKKRR